MPPSPILQSSKKKVGNKRMKVIINGRFLLPGGLVANHAALLFEETVIGFSTETELPAETEVIDANGLYVSPGLVDMHIHGYLGEDASDGSAEGIRKIAEGLVKNGVTSFCPTTMTMDKRRLSDVFHMMRSLREESKAKGFPGAQILGVHAEGPFINPARKGAQNGAFIVPPDASWILEYADILKVVTLAPEMENAMGFIEEISSKTDILLSAGHTDASYEAIVEAVLCGLSHITHTFNGMSPLTHREPGAAGAALTAPVTAELIADTFHIHPGLFALMARAKGDKLVLITDCNRAGGLPDGDYDLGGQTVHVHGIKCRLADGTIAGSVLKLNHAVANMRAFTDLPLYEIVNMASLNPAVALGEPKKGALTQGMDADIILCDEAFEVRRTIVRGETVYES